MSEEMRRAANEKLYEVLDAVHDEATFCAFLTALAENWFEERDIETRIPSKPYSSGALGWENGTIGDFLGAAATGLGPLSDAGNAWSRAAHIIHLGKIVE